MKDKTGWNKYRHKRRVVEPHEAELHIESLTNAGDGLGRLDQRVIFVPYTLPGDRVRIRITQRKKTYALASVVEIVEASADRIEPRCEYFGRCGGCDWQHVPYALQLQAKVHQLTDSLQRIGLLRDLPMQPIVHSPNEYGYRNRIQGDIRAGKFHYKWRRSDQRIAVDRCVIAEEPINAFLQSDLSTTLQGRVEIAVVGDQVSVAAVNDRNSTELGFRQVNTAVGDLLSEQLLHAVSNSDCSQVVDLYCGRGHWSNLIAQQHPQWHITGVDSSADNIEAARRQAQSMNMGNVQFHQAAVEKSIKRQPIADSVCIVDPPRAGLDEAVSEALIADPCQHLLYVSCHPATLARDLKRLHDGAYDICRIVPMDMFPQTAHLECLVELVRR